MKPRSGPDNKTVAIQLDSGDSGIARLYWSGGQTRVPECQAEDPYRRVD